MPTTTFPNKANAIREAIANVAHLKGGLSYAKNDDILDWLKTNARGKDGKSFSVTPGAISTQKSKDLKGQKLIPKRIKELEKTNGMASPVAARAAVKMATKSDTPEFRRAVAKFIRDNSADEAIEVVNEMAGKVEEFRSLFD